MGALQDHAASLLSFSFLTDAFSQTSYAPWALTLPLIAVVLYRLYLHPVAHVPGPWFACISPLFLYIICYLGVEGRMLLHYHNKFRTPVLRIAPDAVSLSNGNDLHRIYITKGGLPKDARYQNFRIEGHDTIFSSLDLEYRDRRAKAVLPMFAPSRVQKAYEQDGVMAPLVKKFITALQEEKKKPGAKVDILDLSSRLSIDILTAYLFNKIYGGLNELDQQKRLATGKPSSAHGKHTEKLSATPFVLAIVAFSRFSLLPHWLFKLVFSSLFGRVLSNQEVSVSVHNVSNFLEGITDHNSMAQDTYQGRLEQAGVPADEILVQCKGVLFAGADSTAVMLSTIPFHLIQQPAVQARLREEIAAAEPAEDPQGIPYLRAVVREGLRLGMANPARLTREVSARDAAAGLAVSGYKLPAGTKVGAAAYVLHHNPGVYPEPFEFRPERWLGGDEEKDETARRSRDRDTFPYGLGPRACIGRNLANHELHIVVKEVIESRVLEGARTCKPKIELVEWFNAEIKGHELEIAW